MIDAVPEPASTLIAAAAYTGAHRGELRGMFWENYRDGELFIARSIWNGITTDPKNRKSKAPFRSLTNSRSSLRRIGLDWDSPNGAYLPQWCGQSG
jgi:hypothetical protein